jgi:polysaccharide biosynthesis protein PslH
VVRILWVKPGKLLPLNTGGQLRTYNILRKLSGNHELTFLSYYSGPQDSVYDREIVEHIPGTVPVGGSGSDDSSFGRYISYLQLLPGKAPHAVSKFTDLRVHAMLREWIADRRFEVAVCDFLASTLNFPSDLTTPTALFQHNVETVLWKRKAEHEAKWLDRMVAKIEYAKMIHFEPEQVRRFHHVIAVSDADRDAMREMVDPSHISVVPTGVDLSQFQYDPNLQPSQPVVVFTGSMDWEANIDGVEFFCREVWPTVLARVPSARFRIVGRNPHPRVTRLARDSVEVTGTVPSIVEHLREAKVFVVPLRIGGGTRIKIYEAMATGRATVSTTVGAEGLDVQHGRDILLEDSPERFAEAVCVLLEDDRLRRRYEAAAAATARRYDWSVVVERFVDILRRTSDAPDRNAAGSKPVRI